MFISTLRRAISALSGCISSPTSSAASVFADNKRGRMPMPVPMSRHRSPALISQNALSRTASTPKQNRPGSWMIQRLLRCRSTARSPSFKYVSLFTRLPPSRLPAIVFVNRHLPHRSPARRRPHTGVPPSCFRLSAKLRRSLRRRQPSYRCVSFFSSCSSSRRSSSSSRPFPSSSR